MPQQLLYDFAQEETDQGNPQNVYSSLQQERKCFFTLQCLGKMSFRGCVMSVADHFLYNCHVINMHVLYAVLQCVAA